MPTELTVPSPSDALRTSTPRQLPITVGARSDALWPAEETASRTRRIHVIALGALAAGLGYLLWRVGATLTPLSLPLGLALLALEAWSLAALALQSRLLWNVDAVRPPAPITHSDATVAVVIPTADEPFEVLMPTLAAATRMRLATEILVLDDGHRAWLAGMCDELGIDYRTRLRPDGYAQQLNSALGSLTAEFIVVLDADQVANRDLIGRTLGHFDDPAVALVQTARDYYNEDSFEHVAKGPDLFAEQALFERVLGAGRNDLNAAFWSGGGAVIRRSALAGIGGVARGTSAPELDTTITLHEAGWRTIHHNEVLSRGRGAADASEFADRRTTLATGAMQVLRKRRLLLGGSLTAGQRASYLSYLTDWLGGWRTLGYLMVPVLALLLALTPATGPVALFVLLFPLSFAVRQIARRVLGRGQAPHGDLTVFGIIRMAATLPATATLVTGRPARRRDADRDPRRVPMLLWLVLALNSAALLWGAATMVGVTGTAYPSHLIAAAAALWAAANVLYIGRAIARIRSRYFGGDRRVAQRIEVEGHVFLDGSRVHVLDLSLTGVRLLSYGEVPDLGTYGALTFTDPNRRPAVVTGTVERVRRRPHGLELGIALEPDQTYVMGAILAEALIRPV